jgi:hypothetical protein
MAQVTNTYDTYTSQRGRETLSDVISRLTPDETPFMSMVGTETIDGTHPEWNTDALATPNTSNKRVQGDIYSFSAISPTTKVGNYTQISMKEFIVSETEERVSKAGPKSDYNREMVKKGLELKIDQEVILIGNQASLAGNSSTAPQLGSLRAWISTNDFMSGAGSQASGGFNTGTGIVDAATNGTLRAWASTVPAGKALLDSAISAAYMTGGNPKVVMLSPYNKTVFSSLMADPSVAQQRITNTGRSQSTIVAAADEYLSDFGLFSVVPNRQMARAGAAVARNIYLLDTSMWKVGVLRPIQRDEDVAKTSDALPGVLKTEYTLIARNQESSAVIADVFGLTAST